MAMKQYPDNMRVYESGIRMRFLEHGRGLQPVGMYPAIIKLLEQDLATYEGWLAQQPDWEEAKKLAARTRQRLTIARRNEKRAAEWQRMWDAKEEAGTQY